jgi:hypothetical protein
MIKFNSTLAFILIFVAVTIGSGLISGLQGYILGDKALREVSQPEVKPGQTQLGNEQNQSSGKQTAIVSETEILKQVNAVMNRNPEQVVPLDGEKASAKTSNQDSFIESP